MNQALSEFLTAQFYAWEKRGRGWEVFDVPVHLEPEFVPFFGHFSPPPYFQVDDGKRPRFFPALQETIGLWKRPPKAVPSLEALTQLDEIYSVRAYTYVNPNPVVEFEIILEKDTRIIFENIEQMLLMLSTNDGIVGFEILGTSEKITIQLVCTGESAATFRSYINAYAPGLVVRESQSNLLDALDLEQMFAGVDLGLRDEFMRPVRVWNKFDPDPLLGIIAAMESLEMDEVGMLQILFQSAINPWAESIQRSVSDGRGGSFFVDAIDMLPLAKEKTSSPLFAVIIRTIGQGRSHERAVSIAERIAQSLFTFHRTGSNTLIPLSGALSCDLSDVLNRRSRRIGMLLNSYELASMVHIPDRSVVSSKLRTYSGKTKKAPGEVIGHAFELGTNIHLGEEVVATLSDQHRLRHMHIIGATGTGKSTLLLKLINQDIAQGRGLTVLDPHGDLIDEVLKRVPEERLKDVILIDPSDSEYPIGLNLLSANSDAEKIILSSDLVALFKRFATSWGDQMTSVLSNAIDAILESKSGGTLIDLRRFLVEPGFRNRFLKSVENPNILYYWQNEFGFLPKNTVGPILTRLDTFLRPRIVRNMMAQKEGLNFKDILNDQKILLVKLTQGLIGEDNSYLLGTLIVTKLHQAAQARQNLPVEERKPYYFYIDEFQHFITPSMSAILSGARKYGLGLILAHQDIEQLARKDAELANSVLSNPAIRVCFRCGDKDAVKLEGGFTYFDATDLQSLSIGEAIVRVGVKDHDFNLTFSPPPKVDPTIAEKRARAVVEHVRLTYALHESKVKDILQEALGIEPAPFEPVPKPKIGKERRPTVETPPKPATPKVEAVRPEGELKIEAQQFIEKEVEREIKREHRFLQEFVKKVAEARNFKAVMEEQVNDGAGKVDVSLLRDDLKIACEISVTNTVEYEVQNIQKCLTAGYHLVFMISNDPEHLHAIRKLAAATIDQSFHGQVFFVSKDEFVRELDYLLMQQSEPTEIRARGYRVRINFTQSHDTKGQEKTLKDIILASIRRKKDLEE